MDLLPLEIYRMLACYLPIADLNNLVKCNKLSHDRGTSLLYRTLQLEFLSGIASSRTLLALQTLSANQRLGSLIRSIDVRHDGKTYNWTLGHSQLLSAVLSAIRLSPERIHAFSCDCPWITFTESFPNLKTLVHKNIKSKADLDWIQWHISECTQLSSITLSIPKWNIILDSLFFAKIVSSHLKELCLSGFQVSELKPARSWNLQRLDLNLCSGSHILIQRLLATGNLNGLKSFRFAGHLSRGSFSDLMTSLGNMCHLEELSLRLGGLSYLNGSRDFPGSLHKTALATRFIGAEKHIRDLRSLVLNSVEGCGKTLRLLVLDFREVIDQPQTCLRFDLHAVQKLMGSCPAIEFIGMPLDLRVDNGRRYRRLAYAKNVDMSASRLKSFHLRGDYRPFSRTLNDAKHISRPFSSRSDIEVFLGHYDKLRKVSFDAKGERKFLKISEDEVTFYNLHL
ncbi:hypothetical protein ACHAO7_010333 [Fusarium culmorum]